MTQPQPALFIGHGSPMTTISDNPERRAIEALGARLPKPEAVLCVTAHWETSGRTHLTTGPAPRTIHDFRGFPQELYEVTYPAAGSAALEQRIVELLGQDRVRRDPDWGFDHGVWGVLRPLFPEADVPIVAMSLDRTLTPAAHLEAAAQLAQLRHEGVMIVASGNVVHNLALWRQSAGTQPEWAVRFQQRINRAVTTGDLAALADFDAGHGDAAAAVNSAEHYLPLLYAAGARLPEDDVAVFNDTINGALSMTSYLLGNAALLADELDQ